MRGLSWVLSIGLIAAAQCAVAASSPGTAGAVRPAQAGTHKGPASQDAALHALGVLLSRQLTSFQLSDSEFRAVLSGFADGYHHPAALKQAQTFVPQLQTLEQARLAVAAQHEEQLGRAYLTKAAALPGAHKTTSGLVYLPVAAGSGPSPRIGDQVKVQYTGKLTDGSIFDSSAQHGGPATFTIGRVIPCWSEGLQLMKVGGKARIVCPPSLAYGERGVEDVIKPGATLDFDVELLDVHHAAAQGSAVPLAPAAPPPRQ
ncbi:MAG TPA: FKBP-type peptidyl-prolyl cis-trans isomerase [Steroidobacteraceae bacterium]|nr:FKBP-type peptidyl-prolyl cis-trans isomerase [Steroidobacteraceae bacterium]